jgi:hypothetical protein
MMVNATLRKRASKLSPEVRGLLLAAFNRPDGVLSADIAPRRSIGRTSSFDHASTEAELPAHSDRWQLDRGSPLRHLLVTGRLNRQ